MQITRNNAQHVCAFQTAYCLRIDNLLFKNVPFDAFYRYESKVPC